MIIYIKLSRVETSFSSFPVTKGNESVILQVQLQDDCLAAKHQDKCNVKDKLDVSHCRLLLSVTPQFFGTVLCHI